MRPVEPVVLKNGRDTARAVRRLRRQEVPQEQAGLAPNSQLGQVAGRRRRSVGEAPVFSPGGEGFTG